MADENPVRRELAKAPLVELRKQRLTLALQTVKMQDAAETLKQHRLDGGGAHGWKPPKRKTKK
jgi:hypothetical protein